MSSMKKILNLILVLLLVIVSDGCSCKKEEDSTVDFYVPDGAPALAIAKLMQDEYTKDGYKVNYHIVNSSTINTYVANGSADIAILPTNAAANLYNKGNDIKLISSNTWGMLYMVSSEENAQPITDLNKLKGTVICLIGQNQVPDLVFKYILNSNNIEYIESDIVVEEKVALKYVTDGSSMLPLLKNKQLKYGILAEPAVTNSINKATTSIVLDLQKEWQIATNSINSYPQASLVAKTSFLEKNNKFIEDLLNEMNDSSSWILENVDKLDKILRDHGSISKNSYTKEIIERCNIKLVTGSEMKTAAYSFLKSLYDVIPNSIGNKLPDENFYYSFN